MVYLVSYEMDVVCKKCKSGTDLVKEYGSANVFMCPKCQNEIHVGWSPSATRTAYASTDNRKIEPLKIKEQIQDVRERCGVGE